jgi:Protein of unknown function (DUF2442)
MNGIREVAVVRYPALRVTFEDGFSGEYDMTPLIARGKVFEPLKDEAFFATVAVGEYGHTFGWQLDQIGREIDFCPDSTRMNIEAGIAKRAADDHQVQRINKMMRSHD